jgi:sialate O-acetylesterase
MIAPLTPFLIRGVIWYQGEANEWDAEPYRRLLPAMIKSWRKVWREGDFPFLIAQLPNFKEPVAEPGVGNWPVIREGQALAAQLPRVEYAVLLGLGDAKDIHPKNKRDVGKRLALTALHTAYGRSEDFSGPRYQSMKLEGKKVRIIFQFAEKGLKNKGGALRGFTVAGADGKFKWAKAEIDGSTVVVWNDRVPEPKAVRYAWADNPDANLYGKNGLPAAPFRTDAFPVGKP